MKSVGDVINSPESRIFKTIIEHWARGSAADGCFLASAVQQGISSIFRRMQISGDSIIWQSTRDADRLNCEQQFKSRAARAVANALFFPSHTHTHTHSHTIRARERERGARTLLYIAGLYAYNVTRPPTHPLTQPPFFALSGAGNAKFSSIPTNPSRPATGAAAAAHSRRERATPPMLRGERAAMIVFFWRHARQSATRCAAEYN